MSAGRFVAVLGVAFVGCHCLTLACLGWHTAGPERRAEIEAEMQGGA